MTVLQAPNVLKRCSPTLGCGERKPEDSFRKTKSGVLKRLCIACEKAGRRQDRQRDYTVILKQNLQRLYGISVEQYEAMLVAQEYRCAACRRHESECAPRGRGRPRRDGNDAEGLRLLVVDHNHVTGRVRALLCSDCNLAFGILGESPDRINSLLRYATWAVSVHTDPGEPAILAAHYAVDRKNVV